LISAKGDGKSTGKQNSQRPKRRAGLTLIPLKCGRAYFGAVMVLIATMIKTTISAIGDCS
jgi:hypothetical protein